MSIIDGMCLSPYKKRITWIDAARGLSILIIVYAHIYDVSLVSDFVHLFHVPIFFVLSGLVWKKAESVKKFALKTINNLVIPYLFVGIISIALYMLMGASFKSKGALSLTECIMGLFYADSRTGLMTWNRPLWFIPCLIAVRIIWELIALIKSKKLRAAAVLLIWAAGITLSMLPQIKLPLQGEVALNMLPFYAFGVFAQDIREKAEKMPLWKCLAVSAAGFAACIPIYIFNSENLSVQNNHYNNYVLFTVGAVCGCIFVCGMAAAVKNLRLLQFIGQNTLCILLWHKFPVLVFQITGFGKKCLASPDKPLSIAAGIAVMAAAVGCSILAAFVFSLIKKAVSNHGYKKGNYEQQRRKTR